MFVQKHAKEWCMSAPLCANESGWKVWNRRKTTTAVLFTAQSSTEPVVKQYPGLILMISCTDSPDFFAYSFWELHLIHMAALWSAKRLSSSQPSSFCNLKQVSALFCCRDELHLFFIVCLWLDVKGAGTVKKTKLLKCPVSMCYLRLIKWKWFSSVLSSFSLLFFFAVLIWPGCLQRLTVPITSPMPGGRCSSWE